MPKAKPTKILIAEDDAFLVKMYTRSLREHGWDIVIVENGEEAISAIEEETPALLLLDLLMPNTDGFAVLEHISNQGYEFPVIVLTNLSQEVDQNKCKQLGAVDFFVKSDIDMQHLIGIIQSYVQKS